MVLAEFGTEIVGHVLEVIAYLSFLAGQVHLANGVNVAFGSILGHDQSS
jgi:hypothetical protein